MKVNGNLETTEVVRERGLRDMAQTREMVGIRFAAGPDAVLKTVNVRRMMHAGSCRNEMGQDENWSTLGLSLIL